MRITDSNPFKERPSPEQVRNVPQPLVQGVADMATFTLSNMDKELALTPGSQIKANELADALNYQNALARLNVENLPGKTPEEKAASFAKMYQAKDPWIPSWGSQESKAEILEQTMQEINEISEAMGELEKSGNHFGGDHLPTSEKLMSGELDPSDIHVLLGLALLKKMKFALKGRSKKKVKGEGSEFDFRQMESFDDISLLDPTEFKMPDFRQRLVDHSFQVSETFRLEEGEKKVYGLLIDRSGSMGTHKKMGIVRAMLITLFEEVRKGEAIVYVSTFEESIDGWQKIETAEEADLAYKNWKEPRGGQTEVGECIVSAQADLALSRLGGFEIPLGSEPELIIVNDGQDRITPVKTTAPVHAISIEQSNSALEELCKSSGGKYYNV